MRRIIPALVLTLLLMVSLTAPVLARSGIDISSSVQSNFPHNLTFNMTAYSNSDITDIFLQYRVEKITTVPVTTVVQPAFRTAPTVETKWVWDMAKMMGNMPPGSKVHYSWKVKTSTGESVETSWRVVEFSDERYDWKKLSEGRITLFWYEGDDRFGQTLLDAALDAQQKISEDTGAYLEEPVSIYVYASAGDLQRSLVFPQEWVGGIAFTEFATVSIGINKNNMSWGVRAIAHELAHLITYQMTYNPYGDIPSWLNEGISLYAEGDLDRSFQSALDDAISANKLFSVQSLAGNFPAGTREAMLAYAQSYSLVSFLLDEYGRERISELLTVFKSGATYDEALHAVYGFDTAGLEKGWRSSLGLDSVTEDFSAAPWSTPVVTGILIALGLILTGAVIYFRRQRNNI